MRHGRTDWEKLKKDSGGGWIQAPKRGIASAATQRDKVSGMIRAWFSGWVNRTKRGDP